MSELFRRRRKTVEAPKSPFGSALLLLVVIGSLLVFFSPWQTEEEKRERMTEKVMGKVREAEERQPAAPAGPRLVERRKTIAGRTLRLKFVTADLERVDRAVSDGYARIESLLAALDPAAPTGELALINREAAAGPAKADDRLFAIVASGLDLSAKLDPYFDISLRPFFELWNFDREKPVVADPLVVESRQSLVGHALVKLDSDARTIRFARQGMGLDLQPLYGGFVLAEMKRTLEEAGVEHYFVFYGADSICKGDEFGQEWRVGLQHPRKAVMRYGVVAPKGGAVMVVNDYERGFVDEGFHYHPVLDPKSGGPIPHAMSAAIVGPDPVVGEALAYAVFAAGPKHFEDVVKRMPGYEAALMDRFGKVGQTPGMAAYLTVEEGPSLDIPSLGQSRQQPQAGDDPGRADGAPAEAPLPEKGRAGEQPEKQ